MIIRKDIQRNAAGEITGTIERHSDGCDLYKAARMAALEFCATHQRSDFDAVHASIRRQMEEISIRRLESAIEAIRKNQATRGEMRSTEAQAALERAAAEGATTEHLRDLARACLDALDREDNAGDVAGRGEIDPGGTAG